MVAVDIDNSYPRTFRLLDLVGYPNREEDDDDSREVWALSLIDSALLTIERETNALLIPRTI